MMDAWEWSVLASDDYDAVVGLWSAGGLPTRLRGRDSRAEFEAQLARGTQTVIGVRVDGLLVGVVLATHDGRKGWINRLAVHPDYRRRGLGLALIAEAERALHNQGLRLIAALIEDWNEASLALFERAGFVDFPDIHYVTKRDVPEV